MPNPVKSLRYINCCSLSSLLKAILAILSDTSNSSNSIRYNCKKICRWSKRPKTILEIRKNAFFCRWSTILLFAKTLLTTEKRLTGVSLLSVDLFTIFLNTGTTDETFQQSGKQDSFRQLLKSSAMMYKSSGSEFFRTITGIQSKSDALDKSRFVITFPTILGVTEISCSPRLAPGGKTGYDIPGSSVLRKAFSKQFCFNRCKRQHLQASE